MINHSINIEQSMIDYYNNHPLAPFSLNQMLIQLSIPLKSGLKAYNRLTQQGQLITIDDSNGISRMIVGLNHPISDLKGYLKQHRQTLNQIAQQLDIHVSTVITVYCHSVGIHNKEKCWEISDWFING